MSINDAAHFNTELLISKADAARRQLETAINLWFHDGDPISVHTLVAAALQLIHDLGKNCGVSTKLHELKMIKPEFRSRFARKVAESENFFKHADRDPDVILTFKPETTEVFIVDAVTAYTELKNERPFVFRTFIMWYRIQHPEYVKVEFRDEQDTRLACAPWIASMDKRLFFKAYMMALKN